MELFRINENYELELNKEWILMIPSFAAVLKGDKGSTGDSEGRKKVRAKKQLAYVYFMIDFKSPIENWEFGKRHLEALRYTDLKESDVSSKIMQEALAEYEKIQLESARSLRTLKAARKGVDAVDSYFENLDFNLKDRVGRLVHNPKDVPDNISKLNKMYDEMKKFEKRVHEELKESDAIRGQATLGDKENRRGMAGTAATWAEGTSGALLNSGKNFTDLSVFTQGLHVKPEPKLEADEELESTDEE